MAAFAASRQRKSSLRPPHGWHATLCIVWGNGLCHTRVTGGSRLLILPDRNRRTVSCSPLEGDCRPARRRTATRTRKGPVFLFGFGRPPLHACAGAQVDLGSSQFK